MPSLASVIFLSMFTSAFARYGKLYCSAFLPHKPLSSPHFVSRPSLTPHVSQKELSTDSCPLEFDVGPYNAAEVRTATLEQTSSDDEFLTKLHESLDYWKRNEYTSAWINVPVHRARIIEALSNTTLGFDLHHTNSTQRTIIMKKWLRDDKQDLIPPFATHQVGCAGFVLNDRNEILLIKEWTGPYTPSGRVPSKQWKLPGGLLDAGESLEEATIREVYEETGVSCDFEGVLAFWHRHGLKFGKSDLYYVCLLRPRSLELMACPVEISDARWMHVDDFLECEDHPLITHVLKCSFRLEGGDGNNKIGKGENVMRLKPQAKMVTGAVQWPGRSPYPTYTSVVTE
ncbi:hypothetical protein HJC23_011380 [Cyclotella cryptica]|uniref:Nudix hydrolase domain-containing protein n=1 Tax=Cyclotella cryptica TaxID=29204 RepID=A0ABD3PQP5_9STRA|eukprot:CCRYP_012654-RA/>CCRYP_012654-RA protein AED:0.00 eAED:0.00 QI:232/-1/1/1/-1/1/1/546/342